MGRLPAAHPMRLAFGLPLRNPEALTNLLQQLYDPNSPQYHQFLTPDEFASRFGPDPADYQALSNFLNAAGLKIAGTHSNRIILDVTGTAGDVEKLLHVRLRTYPHPDGTRVFFAPDTEPSLNGAPPVLHISGLDDYLPPRPMSLHSLPLNQIKPSLGSGPGGTYLGNDFRAAYVPGTALTGAGQAVGLVEFDGYYMADIMAYRNVGSLPNVPLKNILLDDFGGIPGGNNDEVALDINMAGCMAPGLSAILVYEGEVPDDILNRMATDNLAKQLSASWLYPIDPATEQIFLQFAAQGQSFFNAAGDSDAYNGAVSSPADDWNLTSVGGTTLQTTGPGGAWASETVWNWGNGTGTGGGISPIYPIPSWQTNVSMVANHGSTNFRNLPDVALTADNVFLIYDDGVTGGFGGTSCAAPLWAAFTALVNQQAVANGKPMQGFINPALYALGESSNYAAGFHDITTGNNTSLSSPSNYYAVPGYDLCTGWGTPNGTNLVNLLAPLDNLRITPGAGFGASGGVGGPFWNGSQSFFLTNAGTATLNWSAGVTVPWLTATPSNGLLAPGGPATLVNVALNAAASNQVLGAYGGYVRFTNLNDGFAQARYFGLNILTPPAITTPPKQLELLGGATARFTVQATGGAPLSYQWQQNGGNLSDGGIISGSSTTALTLAGIGAGNAGSYTVVVSNAAGMVTSSPPVLLTITPSGPFIVTEPAGQYALAGTPAQLSVFAEGTAPLAYHWRRNSTNLVDGNGITGSSASVLTFSNLSAASAGTYTVVITNIYNTATSSPAVLSVFALAASQLLQNGGFETGDFSYWNVTGNSGFDTISGNALYTHSGLYGAEMGAIGSSGFISQTVATTPGATYQLSLWLDSPDGDGPNEFQIIWNGGVILDSTNLGVIGWTNIQAGVTATASSTTLQIGVRDDASFLGLDDISLEPLESPGGAPIITAQPAPQTFVAAGGSATLTLGAVGMAPLSYQWLSNSVPIAGATNSVLAFQNVVSNQSATYSAMVSNSIAATASSNAVLTVLAGIPESITFDDLGTANATVPAGYGSLQWSNFYHLDSALSAPNPSGYLAGTVSSPNIAFNQSGTPATIGRSTSFDFLSGWFTAAWNDDLRLEAKGYTTNGLAYDQAWFLSSSTPQFIQLNYVGVTNILFTSSGGTPNPAYGGSGFEFVMDNASVILTKPPPPVNDQCGNAIVVTTNPFTNIVSTLGATTNGDPTPACFPGFSNGVWYEFTAPSVDPFGILNIDTSASDFSASVAVYSGTCGSLTEVNCGSNSTFLFAGDSVYVLVGSVGNVSGNLDFRASFSSPNVGPPFVRQAPSNASVPAGGDATFFINAYGQQPMSYTWEFNGTPLPPENNYSPISSSSNATYIYSNAPLSASGGQITCVLSNALGVATSTPATLFVTVPGELVQNGGFETGDFSYWTESGNFTDTYVSSYLVHSGQYGVSLGAVGPLGYLSQALGTTPGQLYRVSLWLDSPDGLTNNEFSVAWNSNTLFDVVNLPRLGWTNLVFNVAATTTNSLLQIGFRDDPSFLGLDDVSVIPEQPLLQSVAQTNSAIVFQWSALSSALYQIQGTTNLATPNWTNIGPVITATNYLMTTTEPIAPGAPEFYRVMLLP